MDNHAYKSSDDGPPPSYGEPLHPHQHQPQHQQPPPAYLYPPSYTTQGPVFHHQTVIVETVPGVTPVYVSAVPTSVSLIGAIVLSVLTYLFCGCVFGLIAFILAMVGQSSASAGDMLGALRMRNASYAVSIVGICIGIAIIALVAGIFGSNRYYYYSDCSYGYCRYYYYG